MINDLLNMKGTLLITVKDALGNITDQRQLNNLVVTSGKTFAASRMASASTAVMGWIAIGTGSTAPALTDTTLGTEIVRVATTVSGGTPSTNTVTYETTFTAGVGTGAITEAGILNASSSGTMLSRTTFAVVNKGSTDEMTISWTITLG